MQHMIKIIKGTLISTLLILLSIYILHTTFNLTLAYSIIVCGGITALIGLMGLMNIHLGGSFTGIGTNNLNSYTGNQHHIMPNVYERNHENGSHIASSGCTHILIIGIVTLIVGLVVYYL